MEEKLKVLEGIIKSNIQNPVLVKSEINAIEWAIETILEYKKFDDEMNVDKVEEKMEPYYDELYLMIGEISDGIERPNQTTKSICVRPHLVRVGTKFYNEDEGWFGQIIKIGDQVGIQLENGNEFIVDESDGFMEITVLGKDWGYPELEKPEFFVDSSGSKTKIEKRIKFHVINGAWSGEFIYTKNEIAVLIQGEEIPVAYFNSQEELNEELLNKRLEIQYLNDDWSYPESVFIDPNAEEGVIPF